MLKRGTERPKPKAEGTTQVAKAIYTFQEKSSYDTISIKRIVYAGDLTNTGLQVDYFSRAKTVVLF